MDGGCNDNAEEVLSTMNEIVRVCKQNRTVPCVVLQAAHFTVEFLIKIKTARRGLYQLSKKSLETLEIYIFCAFSEDESSKINLPRYQYCIITT